MAGAYTAKIVEQDGTVVVSDLARVQVDPLTWTLDEVGRGSVRIPKNTASASSVDLLDKELQVFRDGTLIWWGPMISAQPSSDLEEMRVDVPELSWYFSRRQISDARANKVSNGSFDTDLTGWTNVGASTDSASSTRSVIGAKSLKLAQSTAGVDTYDYQQNAFTAGSIGSFFTLAAWVYIDDSTWGGPAYESRGLFVSGIESGTVRDYQVAEIDDATPRNRWVRLETGIWIPPGETWTLEARLYAPDADVWWDAVQLVKMESLSHYATDIGTIAGNIVDFIQNTTHGWDDLGITTSDVTSGVLLDRHYQYADHIDALEALSELEGQGLDWAMVLDDSPVVRQFTTYYPKGTDRSATVTLSMADGAGSGNLSSYRLPVDGSKTSTRVTVLGEGDGPDREEGYAADASSLGGLVLGEVVNAPAGAQINTLTGLANSRLAASKRLVRVLDVTGIPGDSTQISTLVVGDTVAVSISDGWVNVTGDWRIVEKTLDPAIDTASFILNEVF